MSRKVLLIISIFYVGLNFVYAKEKVKFSSCVDGDTIKVIVNDEEKTVRMLAIDTPESVHPKKKIEYYGKESSEYTCNRVKNAKKIELEYDNNSDKEDKYDRLLAWVFVDDVLLQEELVEKGYAKVAYLYSDYKYTNKLNIKQELASIKEIGIWNQEEKKKFDSSNNIDTNISEYSNVDVIIIIILLFIVVFVSDKSIKKKAKKKLNNYLR